VPWAPGDASGKTHKAKSPKAKRQWAKVANAILKKTGNEGQAVREANGVIAQRKMGYRK
jgi:hypothetical protein